MKKLIFAAPLLFLFSSCAVLDAPKRFLGISAQKFENEKTGRHSRIFDLSKKESYDRTLSAIKTLRARVTRKSYKKGYIAAFNFSRSFDYCLDSTEAGFFIEETGEAQAKITVICNNSLLAQNLAEKFFPLIERSPEKQD